MDSQHHLVTKQFGGTASAYAQSSTHNDAAVLQDLVNLVDPKADETLLDIASGPGTVALAFAPHVKKAVALDLTPSMLIEAKRRAEDMGFGNVETVESAAEALPFPDAAFDIVAVRTAPHHFSDIQTAINEMARVVKPTGRILIVDTTAPEEPDLDRELNEIEKMRDPSHVRNYTPTEWREFLKDAGLKTEYERIHSHALGKRLIFSDWVKRMRVPEETVEELLKRFRNASVDLKDVMQIEEKDDQITFTLPEITIIAKPA